MLKISLSEQVREFLLEHKGKKGNLSFWRELLAKYLEMQWLHPNYELASRRALYKNPNFQQYLVREKPEILARTKGSLTLHRKAIRKAIISHPFFSPKKIQDFLKKQGLEIPLGTIQNSRMKMRFEMPHVVLDARSSAARKLKKRK